MENLKFKIKNSKSGFTLIETVLVVVLVAVCGMVAVDLFIGQNRLYKVQTAELNVTNDARTALDDIDNYTRSAMRVVQTYSTYTSDADTLILQVQSVNASNRLIPATYDHVVFYMDGSGLFREVFPDVASSRIALEKKLASNVNSLNFTYNNISFPEVSEVQTSITIQENAGVQNRAITISSKSKLRNY